MGSREGGSLPSVRVGRPSVAINAGHVRGEAAGAGGEGREFGSVFLGHWRRREGKGLFREEGGPPVSDAVPGRSAWRGIWPLRGRWTAEGGT